MASKYNRYINLYNFALLTLQGYEVIDAEVVRSNNNCGIYLYMHKKGALNNETKIYGFDLLTPKFSSYAASFSESISKNFNRYAMSPDNNLPEHTKKILGSFVKAQSPDLIDDNIVNGSFVFNIEKMFSDLMSSKAYSDVNLMFKMKYLSDTLGKTLMSDEYNIKKSLNPEEKEKLEGMLGHLNEIVTGKEPSNVAKAQRSMGR